MAGPKEPSNAIGSTPLGLDLRRETNAELSRTRLNAEIPFSLSRYLLQEPGGRRGRVITFYSYKGGVGRSRALANVAVQLARLGKSVLCMDFDLEAPGLHHYFLGDAFAWPGGDPAIHAGLVDFVHGYRNSLFARVPTTYVQGGELIQIVKVHDAADIGYIGAGIQDKHYKQRVSNFDWRSFYDHWDGGAVMDDLKLDLADRFDYVLIDSRTGISDISGICSVHLPDILVAVFTPGPQSQAGLVDALQCIEANRMALRPQEPLHILPLPCRVDRDVVRESFDGWFRQLIDSYLGEKVKVLGWLWSPDQYFRHVSIEHFSRFVYEDTIESLVHHDDDEGGNAWKYRNLIRAIEAIGPVEFPTPGLRQKFVAASAHERFLYYADEKPLRLA
ncbi:MAG TPA: AAA family ATPase [Thermoanaerobaculia bacterium]